MVSSHSTMRASCLPEKIDSAVEAVRQRICSTLDKLGPYLFLAPTLAGLLFLKLGPILFSLFLSFNEWRVVGDMAWVGLANYDKLIHSREFPVVMRNTVSYSVGTAILGVVLGLALAILLNHKLRGMAIFRGAFFLPYIMPIVLLALAWTWLYEPQFGLINYFLREFLHVKNPPLWLNSHDWALPSLMAVGVWKAVGYYAVLFLAGLQTIPQELYEVATIDGARAPTRFFRITLPLLTPTTFFVAIMAIINSFRVFGAIYVMTDGGPGISTLVLSYSVYRYAFTYFRMGYASAQAWFLFLIIFALTILQWRLQRLWVFEGY